jgi:hypothetical protein
MPVTHENRKTNERLKGFLSTVLARARTEAALESPTPQ